MILRFWRMLFGGCEHKWKIIDTRTVTMVDDWEDVTDRFTRYHLQCEKCGDVKEKDIR